MGETYEEEAASEKERYPQTNKNVGVTFQTNWCKQFR
jgi:hypothetical protein